MGSEMTDQEYSEAYGHHDERIVSDGILANKPPAHLQQISRIMGGKCRGEVFTSLPMLTRNDKLKLYNLTASQGNALPDMAKGNPVEVEHVILSHAEFTDENGEIKTGAKLILVTPRGEAKVILSQTFIKSFSDIIGMFGNPPFNPPLFISAQETSMKGGRRYYLPKLHE